MTDIWWNELIQIREMNMGMTNTFSCKGKVMVLTSLKKIIEMKLKKWFLIVQFPK